MAGLQITVWVQDVFGCAKKRQKIILFELAFRLELIIQVCLHQKCFAHNVLEDKQEFFNKFLITKLEKLLLRATV